MNWRNRCWILAAADCRSSLLVLVPLPSWLVEAASGDGGAFDASRSAEVSSSFGLRLTPTPPLIVRIARDYVAR
jgi:hypothetical protein